MREGTGNIRFSVIIPAYNAEQTVRRAIASCLEQSYPAAEIIVVSDGSKDRTLAAVREAGDRIICIELEKNNGPAYARNTGMDRATGDYIAFLDADDTWHRDKLQILNRHLAGRPDRKFIFHPFTLGNPSAEKHPLTDAPLQAFPFYRMLWRNPIATPCVVIANDTEFRFANDMRYMEDYDLWLRIARKYRLYYLPVPLTRLGRPVLSAGGQSASRWKMRKGEFRAYTRFACRHPAYLPLLPLLLGFGFIKHIAREISLRTG